MFFFSKKQQNWFFKKFHNLGMVGRKNLGDPSLNHILNALLIGLYTFSLEWPVFGLKCLVTVMPKGQSPTVKSSVCNFPIFEIGSNCNWTLRPANSKWVTMKLKREVEYSMFEPLIPCFLFPLYRIAIVAFQLLYRIGFLFPLDYSLISIIILSDSNCNACLLKLIRPAPFMFLKEQKAILKFCFWRQLAHINQKQASQFCLQEKHFDLRWR